MCIAFTNLSTRRRGKKTTHPPSFYSSRYPLAVCSWSAIGEINHGRSMAGREFPCSVYDVLKSYQHLHVSQHLCAGFPVSVISHQIKGYPPNGRLFINLTSAWKIGPLTSRRSFVPCFWSFSVCNCLFYVIFSKATEKRNMKFPFCLSLSLSHSLC